VQACTNYPTGVDVGVGVNVGECAGSRVEDDVGVGAGVGVNVSIGRGQNGAGCPSGPGPSCHSTVQLLTNRTHRNKGTAISKCFFVIVGSVHKDVVAKCYHHNRSESEDCIGSDKYLPGYVNTKSNTVKCNET